MIEKTLQTRQKLTDSFSAYNMIFFFIDNPENSSSDMTVRDYFKRDMSVACLSLVDKTTIAYIAFTILLILKNAPLMKNVGEMLALRIVVTFLIVALYYARKRYPCRFMHLLSSTLVMLALIFWYQEIYYFASLYPYRDSWFAGIDWKLFGCQPSLELPRHLKGAFWTELFNFGYYSYYYVMAAVMFFYGLCRYEKLSKAEFIFLSSFFMFYAIYEFLPVAGPCYYFKAIGLDAACKGIYPEIGDYFTYNHDFLHQNVCGIFSMLVQKTQEFGELPAAAFPSSHCGMAVIVLILAWRSENRCLFLITLLLTVLICFATIYIQAHYLIDTICGIVFAILFYWINAKIYVLISTFGNEKNI